MAGQGRNLTGSLARMLQLGLDKRIYHVDKAYVGVYGEIFHKVSTNKGFYETLQIAGAGPAAMRSEGQVITAFDSINQDFNVKHTIYSYEKAMRASEEAIADNLYENLLDMFAKEVAKAHNVNKDIQAASIFNSATTATWGDGKALMATDHPLQAGGTNSNRLSPDLDLSQDAIQAAKLLVDGFKNPDGLLGDYTTETLVIPPALQFIASVILKTDKKVGSMNNDINPVYYNGYVKNCIEWRRLTNATTWFILTNQKEDGLLLVERQGIVTKTFEDEWTNDTVTKSKTRFRFVVADHRRVVGSVGP